MAPWIVKIAFRGKNRGKCLSKYKKPNKIGLYFRYFAAL
jgi:hypothetical protein